MRKKDVFVRTLMEKVDIVDKLRKGQFSLTQVYHIKPRHGDYEGKVCIFPLQNEAKNDI
jgi:hypothetical protein